MLKHRAFSLDVWGKPHQERQDSTTALWVDGSGRRPGDETSEELQDVGGRTEICACLVWAVSGCLVSAGLWLTRLCIPQSGSGMHLEVVSCRLVLIPRKERSFNELTRDGGNTAPALLWILIRLIKLRRIFVPYIIVRVYLYRLILSIDITDYAFHFFFKIFDVVLLI